ncbi:MAG: hypothetical protein FWC91_12720 [Defluviitaleaceae bacterium]|nr:hypothetical protein [Defluviitaleaceae bacterium]
MKNITRKFKKVLAVLLILTLLPLEVPDPLQVLAQTITESAIEPLSIPVAPEITPVSQARVSRGVRITVDGHITGSQAPDVAFMQAINASGPNDGILVQVANAGSFTGHQVRVTGYVHIMQGHVRINGSNNTTPTPVQVLNSNAGIVPVDPIPITLEQTQLGFEGMLVSLAHPIQISGRIPGNGTQNHGIMITDTVLRANFNVPNPSSFINNIQDGSWIYVNRGHVLNFLGRNQIYSSSFNEEAYIEMTGISNNDRIANRVILRLASSAIASARAAEIGTQVTIEGHITGSQSANVAFMQSINAGGPNDGILVSISNASNFIGQRVRVTGYVRNFDGNLRINGANNNTATAVSHTVTNNSIARIAPIPITLEQAATGFDGMLVSIFETQISSRHFADGTRNHHLYGTNVQLRTNLSVPTGWFVFIHDGRWVRINRGHVYNFGGIRQIYSAVHGESALTTMTGISNSNRITPSRDQ